MRTALGENQKIQILTQEMIRRLGNTMEGLEDELYCRIVDDFSQKLYNSGNGEEQIRRIIVAGIRGWGGKIACCKAEGRRIRRTAKDSFVWSTKTFLYDIRKPRYKQIKMGYKISKCLNIGQSYCLEI